MPRALRPLSERFAGLWPACAPQFEDILVHTDFDELRDSLAAEGCDAETLERVLDLRRGSLIAAQSLERLTIASSEDARKLLEDRILRPEYRKWTTYALNAQRERLGKPTRSGGLAYVRVTTKRVPAPEYVAREAPLPPGGCYLVIYHGTPEILGVSTVAEELAHLQSLPVADVLIWHRPPGAPPAAYSVGVGAGDRNGERVEFPDQSRLAAARSTHS